MIKVLQICNKAPYPANDGSSIAIYNMALGLIENGIDLHLLTINTKKHYKDDAKLPADFKEKTHYASVYKNTDTTIIGALLNLFSNSSYFVSRFYFKAFEQKLISTLQQNKFDIIQLEGLFMAVYLDIIRKYSKAKVVLRAHNIEYLIWERHIAFEKNSIKRAYLRVQNKRLKNFEEEILPLVDAVITITDTDKEFIRAKNLSKNIFTCITGVNLKEYELPQHIKKNTNTLFYFGSMDWIPNQEAVEWFLNNCWNSILKTNPECKFIIAGRNMPDKFKSMNLPNVLVIENIIDNKEFYSKYDIMLVPLLSGSGLRIKIIEGLSFGKAIVSTSIGAEGIPVHNKKELLLADDPKEFVKAVQDLLSSPELKSSIEKNAKDFALEHLNNKAITANLVTYFKTLS